jgi:predicted Zn-dependent peptidase
MLLGGGLAAGCRSLPTPPLRAEPAPPPSTLEALPPGSTLAVRRPTPGVTLLSLWIDAGSRAAQPPQLATAAALWAADQAGASARVLPDGTELSLLCDTRGEGLASCAQRLLRALGAQRPGEPQLVALRERVRGARVRAATNPAREADRMALEALLGAAARQLDPLGAEADDAALDGARLAQFLGAHYLKSRALLVGVGELEPRQLAELFGDDRPPGTPPAAGRATPLAPAAAAAPRVAFGAANQIALALPLTNVARAASVCERFLQIHTAGSARISQLHGLVVAHLSLPGGAAPFARLQAAVFDLKRILIEGLDSPPLPPPDGLEALSRQVGETWLARSTLPAATLHANPAVAIVLARDAHSPEQSEEAALAALSERAARAVADGAANSAGTVEGQSDALSARVTTLNGAHVEVVRRGGDAWFAATLRFAGGSGEDPPTAHGRAALLASLLADGCGFSAGRALDVWLTTIQARLTPLLDADGLGVSISAPARHAEAALDTLLRCALRPNMSARAVEDARARLLRALWKRDDAFLQATLAQSLVPSAPGTVAPWGTPDGVARVDAGELRRLHEAHAKGPLVSVWVTADRDPLDTARFVARRLAQLPSEAPSPAQPSLSARGELAGAFSSDGRVRVVIGLRSERGARASSAPALFAQAFGEALARRVGQPLWAWGDSSSGLSVAGVALAVREEELDRVPAHTHAALQELAKRPEASFRGALQALTLARSAALSSARGWAEAAFHGRLELREESSEIESSLRKLAAERPSFFVLRPRP